MRGKLPIIIMMTFLSLFEFASESGEYPTAEQQKLLTAFHKEFGVPFSPTNALHRSKMSQLVKTATAGPRKQQFIVSVQNSKGQKETFETIAISPEEAVKKLQYMNNNTLKVLNVTTKPSKNTPTYTANP